LRDLACFARHEDAAALSLRRWLEDPLLAWLSVHFLLEILVFVWQNKSPGEEHEMLEAVDFSQLGDLLVHQILSRYVEGARKVVDLLVPLKLLVG